MKEVHLRIEWLPIPSSAVELHNKINEILELNNVKYVAFRSSYTARSTYLETLEHICRNLRDRCRQRFMLYLFNNLEEILDPNLFSSHRFYLYVFSREKLNVYYKSPPEYAPRGRPYSLVASFSRVLPEDSSTDSSINIVVDGKRIIKVLSDKEAEELERSLEYVRKILGVDLNVKIEKVDKKKLIDIILNALQRRDEVGRKLSEILTLLLNTRQELL